MEKSSAESILLQDTFISQSKFVQKLFDLTIDRLNIRKYKVAIEYFTKADNIEPNNSMAYYYRGSSKIYIRDSLGAIDEMRRVIVGPIR